MSCMCWCTVLFENENEIIIIKIYITTDVTGKNSCKNSL